MMLFFFLLFAFSFFFLSFLVSISSIKSTDMNILTEETEFSAVNTRDILRSTGVRTQNVLPGQAFGTAIKTPLEMPSFHISVCF